MTAAAKPGVAMVLGCRYVVGNIISSVFNLFIIICIVTQVLPYSIQCVFDLLPLPLFIAWPLVLFSFLYHTMYFALKPSLCSTLHFSIRFSSFSTHYSLKFFFSSS